MSTGTATATSTTTITAADVQLETYGGELVREHTYTISDGPLKAFGPAANQPPTGPVPDGARIRLVVTPNLQKPEEFRSGWFQRLGWTTASPLQVPADARRETYGTFVSGGYGVERTLLSNPKYDQPVSPRGDQHFRKEN